MAIFRGRQSHSQSVVWRKAAIFFRKLKKQQHGKCSVKKNLFLAPTKFFLPSSEGGGSRRRKKKKKAASGEKSLLQKCFHAFVGGRRKVEVELFRESRVSEWVTEWVSVWPPLARSAVQMWPADQDGAFFNEFFLTIWCDSHSRVVIQRSPLNTVKPLL